MKGHYRIRTPKVPNVQIGSILLKKDYFKRIREVYKQPARSHELRGDKNSGFVLLYAIFLVTQQSLKS